MHTKTIKCYHLHHPWSSTHAWFILHGDHPESPIIPYLQILELERRAAEEGQAPRAAAVSTWASKELTPEDMYFVDTRGDRNNLLYSGLYRADIAAYHRMDPSGLAKGAAQHHGRQWQRSVPLYASIHLSGLHISASSGPVGDGCTFAL